MPTGACQRFPLMVCHACILHQSVCRFFFPSPASSSSRIELRESSYKDLGIRNLLSRYSLSLFMQTAVYNSWICYVNSTKMNSPEPTSNFRSSRFVLVVVIVLHQAANGSSTKPFYFTVNRRYGVRELLGHSSFWMSGNKRRWGLITKKEYGFVISPLCVFFHPIPLTPSSSFSLGLS